MYYYIKLPIHHNKRYSARVARKRLNVTMTPSVKTYLSKIIVEMVLVFDIVYVESYQFLSEAK